MNNIFENASKQRIRFSVAKGQISTEDLWTLSIESLANLGKGLKAELKPLKEEDDEFSVTVAKTNNQADLLELKIAVVKHILEFKKAEQEKRRDAATKQARKEELLALIDKKKGEADSGKTLEDLEKELASL